jgi:hypothetical protein
MNQQKSIKTVNSKRQIMDNVSCSFIIAPIILAVINAIIKQYIINILIIRALAT